MRSPRSSPDLPTGWPVRLWKTTWPAGLVLGLGAEWLTRSGQSLAAAGADLAVGWTLIGCGLLIWYRRPHSGVGPLLALTGFAWFAGTLAASRIAAVAALGAALLFLHRGPLFHAIIGYPDGRPSGRLGVLVVVVGYVYAVAIPVARSDLVTIGVSVLVLTVTVGGCARAAGTSRRARATAGVAAAVLAIVLAGGSLLRLAGAEPGTNRAVLWVYQAALLLIAVGLLADSVLGGWAQAAVTKLVVDLGGDSETDTLRSRLAKALGDRSLAIAYWLPETGGYADERGTPVTLPEAGSGKAVTVIEHDGERIAALVRDATPPHDPGLADSVAQAARIALTNARLQAQVRNQITELDASRRRILAAGDAQRRRLRQQLQASAGRRLTGVQKLLDLAVQEARTSRDQAAAGGLTAACNELAEAQAELRELAGGIHPALLTERGLGPALVSLAERAPVRVRIVVSAERLPAAIETAVYFVCSEALANVAKHARATSIEIEVRSAGERVTVVVADDGTGGADPSAGSGLKGVADRIEALGGQLQIQSPVGQGTRLWAGIPRTLIWPEDRASEGPTAATLRRP
jgi:signal transduction histidine kinase